MSRLDPYTFENEKSLIPTQEECFDKNRVFIDHFLQATTTVFTSLQQFSRNRPSTSTPKIGHGQSHNKNTQLFGSRNSNKNNWSSSLSHPF